MPSLIQSTFGAGEWADEYDGRTDLKGYQQAVKRARNFVVLPQGGMTRRPGFRFVANAANSVPPIKLRKFSPAAGTRYVLEFGAGYIRFYRQRQQVLSAGVPYQVATPYLAGELAALSFTAIKSQLFIFHGAHPPQILQYGGTDTGWTIAAAGFTDGPYLEPVIGVGATTLTPGAGGVTSTTLTASGLAGINGGTGFRADDVGRWVRLSQPTYGLTSAPSINSAGTNYHVGDTITGSGGVYIRPVQFVVTQVSGTTGIGGVTACEISDPGQYLVLPGGSNINQLKTTGQGTGASINFNPFTQDQPNIWVEGTITAWTSTTVVTVSLVGMTTDAQGTRFSGYFLSTAPITNWRLGAWCVFEGFPQIGGDLFQGRLWCGANSNRPKRLWSTEIDVTHMSFAPSLATGQVIASNAITVDIDDDEAGPIVWINAAGNAQIPQLGIGTDNAEFSLRANNLAVSPTDLQIFKETKYTGGAGVRPQRIGRHLLFVDRSAQRLRQWTYTWMAGGFIGPEASAFGRHLLRLGISEIDYALNPHPIVWAISGGKQLIGLTYLPEEEGGIAAWHSHSIGGLFGGADPIVNTLCVSSAEDNSYDELWIAVQRIDAGGTTQTIEVSAPFFRTLPLDQAEFLDSELFTGLTTPSTTCIAAPGPYQPSKGNLPARGDTVQFTFGAAVAVAADLTPGTVLRYKGGTFDLTAVASGTAVTTICIDPPATNLLANNPDWSYTKKATSFSGFAQHNGRNVDIMADGARAESQVVSGGIVVITAPASFVRVGFHKPAELLTMDLDLPSPEGSTQMKTGRLDHLYLRVFESIGGTIGPDSTHTDQIKPRDANAIMDWPPSLVVNDDLRVPLPGGSTPHRTIYVRTDDPWPLTLLALVVKGGTMEQAPG